jgi:hypothetical protein
LSRRAPAAKSNSALGKPRAERSANAIGVRPSADRAFGSWPARKHLATSAAVPSRTVWNKPHATGNWGRMDTRCVIVRAATNDSTDD